MHGTKKGGDLCDRDNRRTKLLLEKYKMVKEGLVRSPGCQRHSPADVGLDRGLVGGYGQDDRLESFCAVRAIRSQETLTKIKSFRIDWHFEGRVL